MRVYIMLRVRERERACVHVAIIKQNKTKTK